MSCQVHSAANEAKLSGDRRAKSIVIIARPTTFDRQLTSCSMKRRPETKRPFAAAMLEALLKLMRIHTLGR